MAFKNKNDPGANKKHRTLPDILRTVGLPWTVWEYHECEIALPGQLKVTVVP